MQITEDMALEGFLCPHCHHYFRANGTGPEHSPWLSKLLQKLPTDDVLKYGALWHDIAYHLGPYWGTREMADLMYYEKNEQQINKKCHWYSRWLYRKANLRNYQAIREFGEAAYNHKGCDGKWGVS